MTRAELWGRMLKAAREKEGLSQRELALKVGVEQPSVYRWEHGAPVADDRKEALAKALDKTVDELFPWVSV
jgi:transcriptional regulator with XRE-family HTH domain